MATGTTNTKQPSNWHEGAVDVAVQLHPELLMAAKRGDWRKLDDLMSKDGALVPQDAVDDIEAADDDERCLSESALHVVASGGGGHEFLVSATVIFGKAKKLLCARNAMGDTPLHCAARAGSIEMVSHLIDMARRDGGGATGVLRKENKQAETALHEAVRRGDEEMVGVLMSADAELARFPRANGASPLYIAIMLGHDRIAELLYGKDNQLSYSGPDGQNALHAAVLRSERMAKRLLEWNERLIRQGDQSSGGTPLHFAASQESTNTTKKTAKLLLDAYESSAYQPDDKGSFPIHVAAMVDNHAVVCLLLAKCPGCAELRDAQGRTFLHIAVLNNHRLLLWRIVFRFLLRANPMDASSCQVQRLASVVNMQDNEGNTALHIAVAAKDAAPSTVYALIWSKQVQLNLQNNEGKTALDLAVLARSPGYLFGVDPKARINRILRFAGARAGVGRRDEDIPVPDMDKEAEKIKDSATTIGVVSVLIITVSFAAAFQVPGGYNTDDEKRLGTPELASRDSFQAFVVANNLAASCSAMATIFLMYAGVSTVGVGMRLWAFNKSVFFLSSSARALAAAFAFGTYAVLSPVAHAAALLTWALTGFMLIDVVLFTGAFVLDQLVLLNRRCIATCLRPAIVFVVVSLWALWPYVVIGGFIGYLKVHGIH